MFLAWIPTVLVLAFFLGLAWVQRVRKGCQCCREARRNSRASNNLAGINNATAAASSTPANVSSPVAAAADDDEGDGNGSANDCPADVVANNHWVRMMLFTLVTLLISGCTVVVLVTLMNETINGTGLIRCTHPRPCALLPITQIDSKSIFQEDPAAASEQARFTVSSRRTQKYLSKKVRF